MIKNPTARKDNLVLQELDGEILIYDLNKNRAFCLNETSSLVWQLCDGEKTVSEIAKAVSQKLDTPATEDFVWLALDQLKEEELLENSREIIADFKDLSRREVIKKVGLGTMIALPIITGLIAPTAAMAQSPGAGGLGACTPALAAAGTCTCTPAPGGGNGGNACVPTVSTCTSPCRTVYACNGNNCTDCICTV
jgi:hypothetical protein